MGPLAPSRGGRPLTVAGRQPRRRLFWCPGPKAIGGGRGRRAEGQFQLVLKHGLNDVRCASFHGATQSTIPPSPFQTLTHE